jgi:Ca2+-transporting ATPase
MSLYPGALSALWAGVLASDAYLEVSGASGEIETHRVVGDPTEGALVVAAAKAGAHKPELESKYPRVCEVPFDSDRKCMSTVVDVVAPQRTDAGPFHEDSAASGKIYVTACKGAPDVMLQLCTHYQLVNDDAAPLTEDFRSRILAANESMAREALRVLAVAYRVADAQPQEATAQAVEHSLVFLGLFGIIDQPGPR